MHMKKMPLVIAYEYESSLGNTIRKVVLCPTEEEYRRVRQTIEIVGLNPIVFDFVIESKQVPIVR